MQSTNRPLPGKRFAAVRMPPVQKRERRMTKKRWALVAVAILILGAGAVWASGYFDRDPRLAEINPGKAKEVYAEVGRAVLSMLRY